jgi:hypothetical protein
MDILNIKELRAANLTQFAQDRYADINKRNRYIGPSILPAKTTTGLEWEIIKGSNGVPVMAGIHAMQAESGIASRRKQLQRLTGAIPDIKRKIPLDGSTLYKLRTQNLKDPQVQEAVRQVYDDTEAMVASTAARIEWLRWKALIGGAFSYSENDIIIDVDFLMPAENKVTVDITWDNVATADWVSDLMAVCDAIQSTYGVRPTRAVAPQAVITYMLRNTNIATKYVFGSTFSDRLLTRGQLNALLTELNLPQFVSYDVKVAAEDPSTGVVTEERLLPSDKIVLLPPKNVPIGNTLFAPTLDVLLKSQLKTEAPGIYAKAWTEGEDTPILWTKAEALAFPTVPGIDLVGTMTVL